MTQPDDQPQLEAGVGAVEHSAHGDGGRQLRVQGAGQLPEHSPEVILVNLVTIVLVILSSTILSWS